MSMRGRGWGGRRGWGGWGGRRGWGGRGHRWGGRGFAPIYSGGYAYPRFPSYWDYGNFRPYLTDQCYNADWDDTCAYGYSKLGRDSDNSGVIDKNDDWLCCRDGKFF